jgi:hypothetical protein
MTEMSRKIEARIDQEKENYKQNTQRFIKEIIETQNKASAMQELFTSALESQWESYERIGTHTINI